MSAADQYISFISGRGLEMTKKSAGLSALHALDHGAFRAAVELYRQSSSPVDGAIGHLWRAEVALYLLDYSEAETAIAAAVSDDPVCELRRRLLAAELMMVTGAYEAAGSAYDEIAEAARAAGDYYLEARTCVGRARLGRMIGEWLTALHSARAGEQIAHLVDCELLVGLAVFNQAVASNELGDAEAAEADYGRAVEILRRVEDGRYRTFAEYGRASLLLRVGREQEAAELMERAAATAEDLGITADFTMYKHGVAWARFVAGDRAAALAHAEALMELGRATADPRAETYGAKLVSVLACIAGDLEHAAAAAQRYALLSDLYQIGLDQQLGRAMILRVRAKAGDGHSLGELEELEQRTRSGSGLALVRAFVADARVPHDLGLALRAYAEFASTPVDAEHGWVAGEARALGEFWARQSVKVEGRRIVIEIGPDFPLPTLALAKEVIEQEMVAEALERAKGNRAAAGRLLGIDRSYTAKVARRRCGAPRVASKVRHRKRARSVAEEGGE